MNRLTRTGARGSTEWIGAKEWEATAEELLREDIVRTGFRLHRRSSHRLGAVFVALLARPDCFACVPWPRRCHPQGGRRPRPRSSWRVP